MADIEQRALGLLNESRIAFGLAETNVFFRDQTPENEALCRALQRQETAMTSELRPAVEVWDDAIAAWAADTIDTRQAAAAVIEADREAVRAPLLAEIERLTIQLEVESEPSPYCPICGSCGEDGCCGPQRCLYPTTEQAAEPAKFKALAETLAHTLRQMLSYGCPVCNGDCGSANPPVISCPMSQCDEVLRQYKEARDV